MRRIRRFVRTCCSTCTASRAAAPRPFSTLAVRHVTHHHATGAHFELVSSWHTVDLAIGRPVLSTELFLQQCTAGGSCVHLQCSTVCSAEGRVLAIFWASMTQELRAVYSCKRHAELRSFAFDMLHVVHYYSRHLRVNRIYGALRFVAWHCVACTFRLCNSEHWSSRLVRPDVIACRHSTPLSRCCAHHLVGYPFSGEEHRLMIPREGHATCCPLNQQNGLLRCASCSSPPLLHYCSLQ